MNSKEIVELVPGVPKGLETGLRNYWYPILLSEDVGRTKPVSVKCLGEDLVVWRDDLGLPSVLADRCPHRSAKLSLGRILGPHLQCAFHGLRFAKDGQCALVPWEPDDDLGVKEVAVPSYPARELGGYIWAFLGNAEAVPPPLENEVPQELNDNDNFLWFAMPTEIWDTNWLLAIDGGDGFHAVTLHAQTQAVEDQEWISGKPRAASASLLERRVKLVNTPYGVRGIAVDRQGKPLHHGHVLDVRGDRFILPCISTNVIQPVPGVEPYVSRLWQFPADERRSIVQRFAVQFAPTREARATWERLFHDVVRPRLEGVSREDAIIAQSQGDLVDARAQEHLFNPDSSMYEVRQRIRDAFVAQVRNRRECPTKESLVWPVPPVAA